MLHQMREWRLIRIFLRAARIIIVLSAALAAYLLIVPIAWNTLRYGGARQRFADCRGNVMFLGDALLRFHKAHKQFPSATTSASATKPPLSWRVAILPYLHLGDRAILSTYDQNEAWNGRHNSTLHAVDLWYYHCPADSGPPVNTSYVAVIGPYTAFPGTKALRQSDITRGAASTILIVETTASGIHWMKPQDLPIKEALRGVGAEPGPSISSRHFQDGGVSVDGAHVIYADGHAAWLTASINPKVLRQLLDINGPKAAPLD
jgi:hypothetical protein